MSVRWPVEYQVRNLKMENIIQKIREIYPVSDEALQALQANMELRYYPKDTYIVQSGVTDRLVYFIEEGIARSVFHHNGQDTTTWFTLEGDITFGMDSLYYQQPSVESIETLSDCKIYVIVSEHKIHIDGLFAKPIVDKIAPCQNCNVRYFCADTCISRNNVIYSNNKKRVERCHIKKNKLEKIVWHTDNDL